ncbi:hypothetical protein ACFYOF_34605 [Streptomyces sp. NPDC007148]|uniref:hypothetical protein n=1 Tax=unclassified Streptomyces TaxID=2593676 RepID=UPI00342A06DF
MAGDVKVLSVAFGLNAADMPFWKRTGIPYFREVSTRKSKESTLHSILPSWREVDYTCRRPEQPSSAARRLWAGTTGGMGGSELFRESTTAVRPTESLVHDPSFTITAVPARIRFTA